MHKYRGKTKGGKNMVTTIVSTIKEIVKDVKVGVISETLRPFASKHPLVTVWIAFCFGFYASFVSEYNAPTFWILIALSAWFSIPFLIIYLLEKEREGKKNE
jgi:hypothetical protein